MKCPHCAINFHDNWQKLVLFRSREPIPWHYQTAICPACDKLTIIVISDDATNVTMVYPRGANRGPVSPEVPKTIADDYREACEVLPASAKASATLSRRCLQNLLHERGIRGRDLAAEIELLLADSKLPSDVHETVDAIRNFGNFSAHPITEVTGLQIIDVEPHEADWCLEILEALFDHFYVKPAVAKAKKAALDAKLAAAGKPASKGQSIP